MRFGVKGKGIFLILLICCFFFNACGQTEENLLEESLSQEKKAIELANNNDIEGAIKEQRKAVELRPEDEKRLALLGRFLIDRYDKTKSNKDLEEAETILRKAALKQPNDILLRNTLVVVLEKLGNNEGVLKESIEISKIAPDDIQNLTNLGIAYDSVNNYKLARETFEKVMQKNPNFVYGLYHFGEFESEQGNTERAKELFEKAIKSSSQSDNTDSRYVEQSRKRLEELKNQKAKTAKTSN